VSGYLGRFAFLERERIKEQNKTGKWTCVHCGTGIVNRLPAHCPECDRYLSEPVIERHSHMPEKKEFKGRESTR